MAKRDFRFASNKSDRLKVSLQSFPKQNMYLGSKLSKLISEFRPDCFTFSQHTRKTDETERTLTR